MSTPVAVLALAAALLATSFGHLNYKLFYMRQKRAYLLLALSLFGLAPVFSFFALKVLTIGTVYVSTGLSQVLVLFLSKTVLHEKLTKDHGYAMVFIVTGILVYNY